MTPETATSHYARFVYNYKGIHGANYFPREVNLGDYIQSIAAEAFLPNTAVDVDRDALHESVPFQGTKVIANGWYCLDDNHHVFHPNLDPLLVAFHINNPDRVSQQTKVLDQLREFSRLRAIGCRDYQTMRFLQSFGIEAYFSSCLTTTLDRNRFLSNEKSPPIVGAWSSAILIKNIR